ncbi:hypothetical protein CDAR_592871 [Caerostris darwini]|uniref:Uncharacterized protein n=1 Tax=Caerostris darwini TaxID=1538125 RepID=A0AAV4QLW9_9ARAC|nr:hypothetical protein CDAR_592871 [Caerostris darwini]
MIRGLFCASHFHKASPPPPSSWQPIPTEPSTTRSFFLLLGSNGLVEGQPLLHWIPLDGSCTCPIISAHFPSQTSPNLTLPSCLHGNTIPLFRHE